MPSISPPFLICAVKSFLLIGAHLRYYISSVQSQQAIRPFLFPNYPLYSYNIQVVRAFRPRLALFRMAALCRAFSTLVAGNLGVTFIFLFFQKFNLNLREKKI